MRVVVPSKEKEVLEQVTWRLDKLENDTLPQVDLSSLEVSLYTLLVAPFHTMQCLHSIPRPTSIPYCTLPPVQVP